MNDGKRQQSDSSDVIRVICGYHNMGVTYHGQHHVLRQGRVLRVSWMEKNYCLGARKHQTRIDCRIKGDIFDMLREESGMENDVILRGMTGKRRRGRPRTRWLRAQPGHEILKK